MSHLMLTIRSGKLGHGKVFAFTMPDVMLSRVPESAANKNPLGTLKHGTKIVAKVATKTLAKSAGKTNLTLSNPENRAKRCSK